MGFLASILVSAVVGVMATIGAYNFLPLSFIERFGPARELRLGISGITTIQGTDTLKDSRTTINNNFQSLNENKVNISSTTWPQLTTATGLVSIGTTTTGGWNASVITVAYGGTGTTTISSNLVLLGNGQGALRVVNGTGASGQFLTSGGSAVAPTWTTGTVDQTQAYNWTNNHTWTASSTFQGANLNVSGATTTVNSIALQGLSLQLGPTPGTGTSTVLKLPNSLPPGGTASSTLVFNEQGQGSWGSVSWQYAGSDIATQTQHELLVKDIPVRRFIKIIASIQNISAASSMVIQFNNDTGANYSSRYSQNGGAEVTTGATVVNASFIYLDATGPTTAGGLVEAIVSNYGSGFVKRVISNGVEDGSAGTSPTRSESVGVWANTTAAISKVSVLTSNSANFGSGSVLEVWISPN